MYGSGQFSFVLQVVKSANSVVGTFPEKTIATESSKIQLSPAKSAEIRFTPLTLTKCKVENSVLVPLGSGICEIKASTVENDKYLSSEQIFRTVISKQTQEISIKEKSFVANTRDGAFVPPVTLSSGLRMSIRSLTPRVCESTIEGNVIPKSSGECRIVINHPGNLLYESAEEVALIGYIVNNGFTVTCTKGKTVRKITGSKPKCPAGFTRK